MVTTHAVGVHARLAQPIALSAWDQLIGTFFVRFCLFYRQTLDEQRVLASLERLIGAYPILAGRLRTGDGGRWVLHAEGQGARFEVAESTRRWPWPEGHRGSRVDIRPFEPKLPVWVRDRDVPLFFVRLTQLTGGGSVLALGFSHVLGDVCTFDMIFRDWTRAAAGHGIAEVCFDRLAFERLGGAEARASSEHAALPRVGALELRAAQARLVGTLPWLETRAWNLPAAEISQLHEEARAQLDADTDTAPSSTLTLVAQLWRALSLARGRSATSMSLIADVRRRVRGLPERLAANGCVSPVVRVDSTDVPLPSRVRALTAALGSLDEDSIACEIAAARHLLVRRRPLPCFPTAVRALYRGGLMFDSWRQVAVYELDLGAGRPHWFETQDGPLPGLMVAQPAPEADGGIELRVTLPRREWRALDRALPGRLSEQGVSALCVGRTRVTRCRELVVP